jgi:hypothetical protein
VERGIEFGSRADNTAFTCAGAHQPTDFRFIPILEFS